MPPTKHGQPWKYINPPNRRSAMRRPTLFVSSFIVMLGMATNVLSQSSAHSFITDPSQIRSKEKFDVQPFTVEKLYMTRTVGESDWSPDGKQVVFISNITGRNNLWTVPAEGGWPLQLTVSNQRQTNVAWSPNGRWIAYTSDYDGNEQWDLFVVSPGNGKGTNLPNTPAISEENPECS